MATTAALITRIKNQLLSFTRNQEAVSTLAADMTSGATSFMLDPDTCTDISSGLVEIEDELIRVKRVDSSTGQATVMGGTLGRGVETTTAAAHLTNTLVISDPIVPRARILDAINDVVAALYPQLLVFSTYEFSSRAAVFAYEVPAEVRDVYRVQGRPVGPDLIWQRLNNWSLDANASTSDFSTGKAVQILDLGWIVPGQPVQILYTKEPTALTAAAQFSTCGYPDRIAELVMWGACAQILAGMEPGRLQQTSIEATERAPLVPTTSALKAAQYYEGKFAERLAQERERQFQEHPSYATFQGS